MQGNPLALVFLLLAVVFMGLVILLAVLQRRSLRNQAGQVQELLTEARRLAAEERAERNADSDAVDAG